MEKRYCQTCGQVHLVSLMHGEKLKPCHRCGGTDYGEKPPSLRSRSGWRLTEKDVEFLRVQGIDPEE